MLLPAIACAAFALILFVCATLLSGRALSEGERFGGVVAAIVGARPSCRG
ncbi:hypothetical protein [Methylobacterium planeticum]|nr:hypothetical protein [Methylobacterium planeticum]